MLNFTSAIRDTPRGLSPYPERADPKLSFADLAITETLAGISSRFERHAAGLLKRANAVEALAPEFRSLTDPNLRDYATQLRPSLLRHGFRPDLVARSFALAREVSRRQL